MSAAIRRAFGVILPHNYRVKFIERPRDLDALIVLPERMSTWSLYKYVQHLAGNRQKTERYEIAMWKKLFYPLATLVMMALALPFAYMQARAGMVGVKVFLGIMLGILFHMMNSLFAHIGLLQNWPPLSAAPSSDPPSPSSAASPTRRGPPRRCSPRGSPGC